MQANVLDFDADFLTVLIMLTSNYPSTSIAPHDYGCLFRRLAVTISTVSRTAKLKTRGGTGNLSLWIHCGTRKRGLQTERRGVTSSLLGSYKVTGRKSPTGKQLTKRKMTKAVGWLT